METVRVIPGKFPPTISTTPNSPRVCAKLSTHAVTRPGHERGRITLKKVRDRLAPKIAEASSSFRSNDSKEAMSGCTAKGKLYRIEAITRPVKVNARVCPNSDCHNRPRNPRGPKASQTKKPSNVGGSTKGRATIDSNINLPRQRTKASA